MSYEFDSVSAQDWRALNAGLLALHNACRVWRVEGLGPNWDWKRNAGASHLERRYAVSVTPVPPPYIDTNVTAYCIDLGCQRLFFMPDRLYVWQGNVYGAVDYKDLSVDWGSTTFRESEQVPSDATVVGQTWQYVNKDGGPDRRFSQNRPIPITTYGLLVLRSRTGMNLVFEASTVGAANVCAEAIHAWSGGLAGRAS